MIIFDIYLIINLMIILIRDFKIKIHQSNYY